MNNLMKGVGRGGLLEENKNWKNEDIFKILKGKAIPVTGCGVPYGSETSWLPYLLDSRLTDGGEVVSLTRQSPF
jgi:hypothetical protein